MSKAIDLLVNRKKELEAEVERLAGEQLCEIRQIDAALRALRHLGSSEGLFKENIISILKSHRTGLKTAKIADPLRKDYESVLSNKQVSWKLSHMKQRGVLKRGIIIVGL